MTLRALVIVFQTVNGDYDVLITDLMKSFNRLQTTVVKVLTVTVRKRFKRVGFVSFSSLQISSISNITETFQLVTNKSQKQCKKVIHTQEFCEKFKKQRY